MKDIQKESSFSELEGLGINLSKHLEKFNAKLIPAPTLELGKQ